MDDKFDGIVLTLFGHNIEFQQSIINWLILCVLFSIFFISVSYTHLDVYKRQIIYSFTDV